MNYHPVHWHEGMFLGPHHFQSAQRHLANLMSQGDKWDLHYNWGLRHADIDLDALSNHRLVIRALKARLRDGSLVSIPEDGILPVPDLKPVFVEVNDVTVFLAVPVVNLGKANVSTNSSADGLARYSLDTQNLEDENTGLNPRPVQMRLLNCKLLLSNQDSTGYETIAIARIKKSSADGKPELDDTFYPPVLAVEAWKPLQQDMIQYIYNRIGSKLGVLANQITSRNMTFDSQGQGDRLTFEQLRVLNESYASLGCLAFAEGIHPLITFHEFCRIIGNLAIFHDRRRPPELPRYDHDDLGTCYHTLKRHLIELLEFFKEPEYKERPFIGAGLRMQVTIESAWLEPTWVMFAGVLSPTLSDTDTIRLLTKQGLDMKRGLDMKIGSSDRVDDIFQGGKAGLKFTHTPRPPRALPLIPGLVYFQINRESQLDEWANVTKTLTLAIRLNEHLIAGNIQGQRVLNIRTGGQTHAMQFTLYVMPREK